MTTTAAHRTMVRDSRRSAFVPEGIAPMTPEGTDLIVYQFDVGSVPRVVAFRGNGGKPIGNYRFNSAAHRGQWVERLALARRAELDRKTARAAERKSFRHTFKVDEVLVCSWGYEQTNVEFYQVTATTEQTVTLREIGQASVDDAGECPMTGMTTAAPGKFVGDAETFRPSSAGGVKLTSYKWARRWDGKPERFSTYG
jgi:hypothetical protein